MKKVLVLTGLVFSLIFCSENFAFAEDLPQLQAISEIGTLVNGRNFHDALIKCNEAVKQYPENAELYYWRGTILSRMGNDNAALIDYNKAAELNPKHSTIYVMRGISKSNLGDNEGAMKDYNKALEINPKDASAYSMRALEKISNGDNDGANKDFEAANILYDIDVKDINK